MTGGSEWRKREREIAIDAKKVQRCFLGGVAGVGLPPAGAGPGALAFASGSGSDCGCDCCCFLVSWRVSSTHSISARPASSR